VAADVIENAGRKRRGFTVQKAGGGGRFARVGKNDDERRQAAFDGDGLGRKKRGQGIPGGEGGCGVLRDLNLRIVGGLAQVLLNEEVSEAAQAGDDDSLRQPVPDNPFPPGHSQSFRRPAIQIRASAAADFIRSAKIGPMQRETGDTAGFRRRQGKRRGRTFRD
jgi:hypothetical protein